MASPLPSTETCPLTGRLAAYEPRRGSRPRPARTRNRAQLPADRSRCPFCCGKGAPACEPAVVAGHGDAVWRATPNNFPSLSGPSGAAWLALADTHTAPLTRPRSGLADQWAAMLAVQQQLVAAAPRWALPATNIGAASGASQHHPHSHVLCPDRPVPAAARTADRLGEAAVARTVLADKVTIATHSNLRLVLPVAPYGPGDLRVVPESNEPFAAADVAALAQLTVLWVAVSCERFGDLSGDEDTPPFDGKLAVLDRTPGGAGRWFADLLVPAEHPAAWAAASMVDVDAPARQRAAELRDLAGTVHADTL